MDAYGSGDRLGRVWSWRQLTLLKSMLSPINAGDKPERRVREVFQPCTMSEPPQVRLSPSIGVKHGPVYSKSSLSVPGTLHAWAEDPCSSQPSTFQL